MSATSWIDNMRREVLARPVSEEELSISLLTDISKKRQHYHCKDKYVDRDSIQRHPSNSKFALYRKNISDFELDAIVNSANEGLLGGGGIDEAIHKAAGPLLQRECASLNTLCLPGEAVITKGYRLPATYVIHTTGPYLDENDKPQWDTLKRCYVCCLSLMEKYRLRSIALPPVSSGFYGHPKDECADVAVSTVLEWLSSNQYGQQIETVVFAALDDDNLRAYRKAFAKHL